MILRFGLALVLVGTIASIVTLIPLVTGQPAFPVAVYLLAMLAPLGLALVSIGLWRQARNRRQRIAASRNSMSRNSMSRNSMS